MQLSPKQFLALSPVLSRLELRKVLADRNGEVSENTVNAHLQTWQKQGLIKKVRNALYVRCDENGKVTPSANPHLIASKVTKDSILSHHSALELHGSAQSVFFNKVTFITLSSPRQFSFDGVEYESIKPRPKARNERSHTTWVDFVQREGEEIAVTTVERTLVDVLDRIEISGGIEEVWESISAIPALNFKELARYITLLQQPVVTARVGFYLERRKEELVVPGSILKQLKKIAPRSKVYFSRKTRGETRFIEQWNLVVPKSLIGDTWEGLGD